MALTKRERERLNRIYRLVERGIMYVLGVLKQKINVGGIKIKRYDERCQQFRENQLFRAN